VLKIGLLHSTAEKCSAGTSETAVLALLKKKNQTGEEISRCH